jgi:hypothetical protein
VASYPLKQAAQVHSLTHGMRRGEVGNFNWYFPNDLFGYLQLCAGYTIKRNIIHMFGSGLLLFV